MIKFVVCAAHNVIAPPAPAGTIAALASTLPSVEFSVETFGYGCPAGHTERKGSVPKGTAVKLSEYATAEPGMLQPLDSRGMLRFAEPGSGGPPNWPVLPCPARVSTARQGVIGKNPAPPPRKMDSVLSR